MATLPHERDRMFLDDIVDDCLKGRNKLVVVLGDVYSISDHFRRETIDIVERLKPFEARRIKIFREAIEFDNGAKIIFHTTSSPHYLRGLKPDRIVLMGKHGELWYLLLLAQSMGAKIEAVA